ncbi:hypothetical protein AX16_007431 [Volvariella volvacea WC 439]|nr:hypothetical protein AX16_007431 [Volvariella volvacea WC 439]
MQHFGKAALRVTKNYTKGYSDTQAKVRDATSNDPWGPSGTQMNEIAQLTYNQNDFVEIMEMLDKRLNDKGKNWRHVFKSLTVLDYCLHQGSENVVIYFRDNLYVIKTLKEFQYIDEDGKDQGANVRQKAKDITNLLIDEARLREERRARANMRDRMIRGASNGDVDDDGLGLGAGDENFHRRQPGVGSSPRDKRNNRGRDGEEDELKRAIEESKRTLAQEQQNAEERDLAEAIRQSEEEERKRHKAVDDTNASSLFDDTSQITPASSQNNANTNNPFPLLDPTPYAVGLQPQLTQIQPQYTIQPQFTAFNPYQQQLEQEAAQAEYLRQQQLFLQQQQQQEEFMRQQQLQQLQFQQQQQQQQQQSLFLPQQQLAPQPTGFGMNNPFAQVQSPTGFSPSPRPTPARSPSFNLPGTYDTHTTNNLAALSSSHLTPSPQPLSGGPSPKNTLQVRTRRDLDENQQHLADLFANRDDGQDTFGNVGALRYGHTDAGRHILAQKTGNNPFAQNKPQQNSDQPFFSI